MKLLYLSVIVAPDAIRIRVGRSVMAVVDVPVATKIGYCALVVSVGDPRDEIWKF
jgi:hypothetical protein